MTSAQTLVELLLPALVRGAADRDRQRSSPPGRACGTNFRSPGTTDFPVESEVINYQLETDELLTIEAMGSGLVVVLFLVCLDSKRVFFVNLTDAVDKILTPESADWRDQRSKVIRVPALNELTPTTPLLNILRFYGARPKLTGMFSKVHFQWAELGHGLRELSGEEWHAMASHFTDALRRLDVWDHPSWAYLLGELRSWAEEDAGVSRRHRPRCGQPRGDLGLLVPYGRGVANVRGRRTRVGSSYRPRPGIVVPVGVA